MTRGCDEITAQGLTYVAGIGPNTSVWPPGMGPLPPRIAGSGTTSETAATHGEHQPVSVKALALSLPAERGKPSPGARAPKTGSPPASPAAGYDRPIAIPSGVSRGPKNGC